MSKSMIENMLDSHMHALGIEDYELVEENGLTVLKVDFKNKLCVDIYSNGTIGLITKEPIPIQGLDGRSNILQALSKHVRAYDETTQKSDDAGTSTNNHP